MKYITDIYAMQFDTEKDMVCDWHAPCLNWKNTKWGDSETSPFGEYGLHKVYAPYLGMECYVANPIRAALDMFISGNFMWLQGSLRKDFILNDKYNEELFSKVIMLKDLPHWDEIDKFMEREYMLHWLRYKGEKTSSVCIIKRTKIENQKEHIRVMRDFLDVVNKKTDYFILKGGAALMLYYGLDRFSEDIDFDVRPKKDDSMKELSVLFTQIIEEYCRDRGYTFRELLDVVDVDLSPWKSHKINRKIVEIDYGGEGHKLIVKCPLWTDYIREEDFYINKKANILVYNIEELLWMKTHISRRRIRDLYDLFFIVNNYWDELSSSVKHVVSEHLFYSRFEYVDYLIETQKDDLINTNVDRFKEMFLETKKKLRLRGDCGW